MSCQHADGRASGSQHSKRRILPLLCNYLELRGKLLSALYRVQFLCSGPLGRLAGCFRPQFNPRVRMISLILPRFSRR